MKYHYTSGVSRNKNRQKWKIVLPLFGLLAGLYLLINTFAPAVPLIDGGSPQATAQKLVTAKPGSEGNRLYIPQINVDVAVAHGSGTTTLEKGAWHRYPQNGDPVKGGNFVLSAHRFLLGMTPQHTKAKSPFYNIDKLQIGDELFVDWEGKRYVYEVSKKYKVERTAVEIEAPSKESKMTLYSCDLRGEEAGREVLEAQPTGVVAWNNNKPYIEAN